MLLHLHIQHLHAPQTTPALFRVSVHPAKGLDMPRSVWYRRAIPTLPRYRQRFEHETGAAQKRLDASEGHPMTATLANSGLRKSVPKSTKPDAFISSSTKASESFLKTIVFTGKWCCLSVSRSPMSIAKPPSPEIEIT